MNEWQGAMWNDCGTCNWTRRESAGGRVYCAWCKTLIVERLRKLAENLRWAAALCHSYSLGRNPPPVGPGIRRELRTGWVTIPEAEWRPGCGVAVMEVNGDGEMDDV